MADPGGIQILSFLHTNFLLCRHIGPCPPPRGIPDPLPVVVGGGGELGVGWLEAVEVMIGYIGVWVPGPCRGGRSYGRHEWVGMGVVSMCSI